ncbi:hypothetical protein NPIL_214031 [Nephila pilipes]|uniref:Uncharacterized protein n=1 Tax=Nephila pilipes TaxID=299642 RepID=A0A8X6P8A5_NEPPI|nr:hypothetical protein NPIL_214031 [Nephila pilipes]
MACDLPTTEQSLKVSVLLQCLNNLRDAGLRSVSDFSQSIPIIVCNLVLDVAPIPMGGNDRLSFPLFDDHLRGQAP